MIKRLPNREKPRTGNSEVSIMTNEWIAWLAGIVDGEGTISICLCNRKNAVHSKFKPCFQISNTNVALLRKASEIIESLCGLYPHWVLTNKRMLECKVAYRISMSSQGRLLMILPRLLPYLTAKHEQAELALDYCTRRKERTGRHWYAHTDKDRVAWIRCAELNRRGATVESGGESPAAAGEGAFQTNEESLELAEMPSRLIQ